MFTRKQDGFSLVPIIAIGVISAIWLLGMAALVLPSYQKASKTRKINVMRSAAETSLDWAVAQLNRKNMAMDPTGGGYVKTAVPPEIVDPYGAYSYVGAPQCNVWVFNQAPPATTTAPASTYTSYVYDPYLDPNTTWPTIAPVVNANGWRRVVARATWGDPSKQENIKTVQVILKPSYQAGQPIPGNPLPPVPFFEFGLFGGKQVSLNGNQLVDAYDSRVGSYGGGNVLKEGDVGTNGVATMTGNATIKGDMVVSNKVTNPNDSNDPGYTSDTAAGTSGSKVDGNLVSNGNANGFDSSNVTGTLTDGYQGGNYTPLKEMPAAPQPPGEAHPLGDVSLSGKQTLILTAGDYTASSLNISGQARIIIDASAGPVNIYMVGQGNVTVSGNGMYNPSGKPSNLRIWSGSSAPTVFSGNGDFTGVMYAPNSAISVVGNGSIYGALAGSSVYLKGGGSSGGFHYDIALRDVGEGITYQPPPPMVAGPAALQSLQTVSWQEVDTPLNLP